jgi:hypothetical protein
MTQAILTYSRGGLEDDQVMWENMSLAQPPKYVAQDAAILQFHEFCERFAENEVEIVHTNGVHHYEAT